MALDYKTLQPLTERRVSGDDGYCPECGRPWSDPARDREHRSPPFRRHVALLGVVGLYMGITFGLRAVRAYYTDPRDCAVFRQTQELVVMTGGPSDCVRDRASELQRDLLVTTAGWTMALIGLGTFVRRRHRARSPDRESSILGGIWGVGEGLIAVICLQLLALYVDFVAVRFSLGLPVNGETLTRAADGILGFISIMTGF